MEYTTQMDAARKGIVTKEKKKYLNLDLDFMMVLVIH